MDFVFDVIFGLLLELFKAVCPDYELKKWQSALLIVIGLIVLFATIGCFVAGLVLLNEYAEHKALGVALTAVGVSLFLIQGGIFGALIGLHFKAEAKKNNADGNADGDSEARMVLHHTGAFFFAAEEKCKRRKPTCFVLCLQHSRK